MDYFILDFQNKHRIQGEHKERTYTIKTYIKCFESRTLFPKVCFIYISFFLIQLGVQPIILKQFYIYMAEFHQTINKM